MAPSLPEDGLAERLGRLRGLLKPGAIGGPDIAFSVGSARLVPGGQPEAKRRAS